MNKQLEVSQLNELLKQKGPKFKFFYVDYDQSFPMGFQPEDDKEYDFPYVFFLVMDMTIYYETESFEEMKNYIITKQKFN